MSNDLMVYLKTTDTCQLNCEHCFTSGTNGKKGWFNTEKTIDFFKRLHQYNPDYNRPNISFHGGEPMLAPTEMLFDVYNNVNGLWKDMWWSVQTNLTYPLLNDKMDVFEKICQKSFGTSWDKNMRWRGSINQELQWEHNCRTLNAAGYNLTVMISLNRDIIACEPIEIIDKMADLGFAHIAFERITANGNARFNMSNIMPSNKELDAWFLKMWHQCVEHKTYEYIDNMFFNSILTELVYNTHAGCRCRQCEQKILTINADGTIGGCPNGAVESQFGTIDDDIFQLMTSEGRMCNIQSELVRHPFCSVCPVFDVCNGDCHQLSWEGNTCAAPKSMMKEMKASKDHNLFNKFLNGFVGQE